jgi:hypothetical protein
MSHIGKESRIVELIQIRTKLSKEDIYDVLWHLPEVFAEILMEESPNEKCDIHLGVINVHWQDCRKGKQETVFTATGRFKKRMAELKLEGKTPLARELYSYLKPNIKDKIIKRLSKNSQPLP